MVERLFLAVPRGCLQFVIVVFPDHTHLLFLNAQQKVKRVTFVRRNHFASVYRAKKRQEDLELYIVLRAVKKAVTERLKINLDFLV